MRLVATGLDFIVFLRRLRTGDGQERVIESVREVAGVSEHGDLATNELWGPDAAGAVRRRAEVQVQCHDDLVAAGWRPAGGEWA